MSKKRKKIVCLGGGNAMPKAVLAGLKEYPVKISVICAMLDSGGSAGEERKYNKTGVSFGDIRRAALILSEADPEVKKWYASRFKEGPFKGYVMANIFSTATVIETGSPEIAIGELRKDLKIPRKHQLLPATLDDATLSAELENGKMISGETNIDIPKHNGNLKIKRVFLRPKAKAYPESLEAIKKADLIVIGPGDLYSSLSQILLVGGVAEAISKSKAKKVYICNLMTKHGETNNFTILDFVKEIEKYLESELDYVIYNNFIPSKKRIKNYRKKHPELLELVPINEDLAKAKFIGKNLLLKRGPIEHSPKEITKTIINLCKL